MRADYNKRAELADEKFRLNQIDKKADDTLGKLRQQDEDAFRRCFPEQAPRQAALTRPSSRRRRCLRRRSEGERPCRGARCDDRANFKLYEAETPTEGREGGAAVVAQCSAHQIVNSVYCAAARAGLMLAACRLMASISSKYHLQPQAGRQVIFLRGRCDVSVRNPSPTPSRPFGIGTSPTTARRAHLRSSRCRGPLCC